MYPSRFRYEAPRSLDEAIALLHEGGEDAKVLAGGQSLVPLMKLRFASPELIVDINNVPGLAYHRTDHDGSLRIGALCRHADLERSDVTIVNRERGAGSRLLLDARLRSQGIPHLRLHGYESIADGHLPAARRVSAGEADCCVAVASAARILGLGFIPLVSERYDLVVHRRHLQLSQVQALFNTLGLAAYRRELEHLGGYDTSVAGRRVI